MRHRDQEKQEAIINATVQLVNEIGFASSSVSKIARHAGVSPATIYIYYENKEDLLVSTYLLIKEKLSSAILVEFNDDLPIRDILKKMWTNAFDFTSRYPDYFQYTEQFANSAYADRIDPEQIEGFFKPMIAVLQRGIDEKIIKNVNFDMLSVFMFYPVMLLSNPRVCHRFNRDSKNIKKAFDLAWDAIKL